MKILHIGTDSQFVQFIARYFEMAAPTCNEYVTIAPSQSLKYPISHGRVHVVPLGARSFLRVASLARSADVVVAHAMSDHSIVAFISARRSALKVWSGWGFDYYGKGQSNAESLLGSQTRRLISSLPVRFLLSNDIKRIGRRLRERARATAVSRADFFSAPIPDDLAAMREAFPDFRGEYAQLNYGSVDDTFSAGIEIGQGQNILVGNSASETNNHLEVFEILSRKDLSGRRVVVPLSYGDASYRQAVLDRGKHLLGEAFQPLVDFLPLQQYVNIVAGCGLVVMGHRRQQALGNIGSALYHGAWVYLDQHNPLYECLGARGAILGTLQQLEDNILPQTRMAPSEIVHNREVLEAFWGESTIIRNVDLLVREIRRRVPT